MDWDYVYWRPLIAAVNLICALPRRRIRVLGAADSILFLVFESFFDSGFSCHRLAPWSSLASHHYLQFRLGPIFMSVECRAIPLSSISICTVSF